MTYKKFKTMVQTMNFKKLEVMGATKEEAMAKVPFAIFSDATQAFKRWKEKQHDGYTETDVKQFMLDQLALKTKNMPGFGLSITLESAVVDSRMRPYTITDNQNKNSKHRYKMTYQILDKNTHQILAETNETKAKAKELMKDLYTNKGYKGDAVCVFTKQVVEGEKVAFDATYTPSKNACPGKYLVFGIEKD